MMTTTAAAARDTFFVLFCNVSGSRQECPGSRTISPGNFCPGFVLDLNLSGSRTDIIVLDPGLP